MRAVNADHIALIHPRYLRAILAGSKRIEARLTLTRRAPFARVHPHDRLCLIATARRGACLARVERVLCIELLSPAGITRLRRTYNHLIHADPAFWRAKRHARFATLLWLTDIHPCDPPPDLTSLPGFSPRSAWHTLPAPRANKPTRLNLASPSPTPTR
jgi:hypothetical protein